MAKGNIPLSNSGTLKTPLDGDKQWERPHSPHGQTLQTTFRVVSPTPLQHPLRMMCKRCEEGGANLVQYLMGKALNISDNQYENVRNWSYKNITHLPQAEQKHWQLACQEELDMLPKRKVFELIDHPHDRKVIKNRWVFDVKSDGCKKACLVAKGFSQVEGLDFNQVFYPVVRFETVRLMLVLAALEDWYITGLDVHSAYLYGKLNKKIYMEQPEGFAAPRSECKVLCLWHALYGLKQAGLAWWCTLNESLQELRFECLKSEAGIFFYKKKGTNIVIGIIYIDNALFCSPNKAVVDSIKVQFMCKWECRDLGELKEFLRMCHDRDHTYPYSPYSDLSTPIPSHQNHSRAPNDKPKPSGSIPSQLASNASPNPLTPSRLSNTLPNTPTPSCLANAFLTRHTFDLSSPLRQVDS